MERLVAAGGLETDLWLLKRWLYGQRKAPQAWTDWHASVLGSMEFEQDPACPAIFYSESRSIVIDTHADDGCGTGPPENVTWFQKGYTARIKCNLEKNRKESKNTKRKFTLHLGQRSTS